MASSATQRLSSAVRYRACLAAFRVDDDVCSFTVALELYSEHRLSHQALLIGMPELIETTDGVLVLHCSGRLTGFYTSCDAVL